MQAAVPAGQRPASPIVPSCRCNGNTVNHNHLPVAADLLTGQCGEAFDQRHAVTEIAARGEPFAQRCRWIDHEQIAAGKLTNRLHTIKPDGHAGRGVPDKQRARLDERGGGNQGKTCDCGRQASSGVMPTAST